VVEPALLRARVTRAANASVFLFSMGFFPLLLASVLYLTEAWGYSVLQAGLAIAPGPLMVALLSGPAGSLAGRVGPRRLVLPGVSLFAVACLWQMAHAGRSPAYLVDMLPALLMVGTGVALTFPVLAGAAVSGLPPERSATGSAVFNMARQIGGVVGIAVFVAMLGTAAPTISAFQAGWAFMAGAALAAGAAALLLSRPRPAPAVPRAAAPVLEPLVTERAEAHA